MSSPNPPQRRHPTPGKRVERPAGHDDEDERERKRYQPSPEKVSGDVSLISVTQVKKLKFSLNDYKHKFIAKVVCLVPPKEHKSEDVHFHRRALVLADSTDFIRGFLRTNDDTFIVEGKCYMFSKFKIFRHSEILIHDDTTKHP